MAITRCPYCHAIIDEADKYCNNCGTQLLFSEDEEVEEEIPGEKIVDAEVEEKDYTVDEPEDEKRRRPAPAKDLEAEIDEELEKEIPPGTGKTAIEELMAGEDLEDEEGDEDAEPAEPTEEVVLVDEIEAEEAAASGTVAEDEIEESAGKDEDLEDEEIAKELEEDLEDEIEEEPVKPAEAAAEPAKKREETREYGRPAAPPCEAEEPEIEYVTEGEGPEEAGTFGEASLKPATFDSQELENLGRTVELGREKIDKFIEVMAARKAETGPLPVEPRPEVRVEAEPEAAPEPGPEKEAEIKAEPATAPGPPPTGSLPPWASTMKGAPVFVEDTSPVERKVRGEAEAPSTDEVEIFPRRRDADSTIGLPEKVSQAPLPFSGGEEVEEEEAEPEEGLQPAEEEAGDDEGAEEPGARDLTPQEAVLSAGPVRPARESVLPPLGAEIGRPDRAEAGEPAEAEEPATRPPFSFSVFFKSKLFDLLFVGLFWLVALWLAASSMDSTLFDVLGSVSGSMLLLYGVFVLLYFFLFKFFLGETIGDRLFRPRE